jgi:hypothetical protein
LQEPLEATLVVKETPDETPCLWERRVIGPSTVIVSLGDLPVWMTSLKPLEASPIARFLIKERRGYTDAAGYTLMCATDARMRRMRDKGKSLIRSHSPTAEPNLSSPTLTFSMLYVEFLTLWSKVEQG